LSTSSVGERVGSPPEVRGPPSPRLLDLLTRGISWKIGSQVTAQGLRLATTIVLVHLLAPTDYGLAAMALVLTSFAVAFSDLGFGSAIVQRSKLSEVDVSTAFWISVAAGTVFTAATAALSQPLGHAYGHPAVAVLILGVSPIFLLDSLATTQRALLARKVDFRSLELRGLVGVAAGSVAAILAAAHGAGAWALVIQELVMAIAGTLLLWRISSWRPSFAFSRASMRDLGGYASRKAGSRFLGDLTDTADSVLVGRFLGPAPLAIYAVAYKTTSRPMVNLVSPLQEVLFPVLARAQHDPRRVANGWVRVTRLTAAVTLPVLIGVAILAKEFMDVVLGPRWVPASDVIRILAIVGVVQALTAPTSSVLGAVDAMSLTLRLSTARTALNLAAFAIGLHWGILGVATAYAVSSLVMVVPTVGLTSRRVGGRSRALFGSLRGPVLASLLMSVVLVALRQLLVAEGVDAAARLGVLILCGAIVYLASVSLVDRGLRDDMKGVFRSLARRRREALT
jgi:O-antigen/teichoic acid export membrane protein